MDYIYKTIRKISIKGLLVNIVGMIVSMSIIWGVSYLILVTFSMQENAVKVPVIETKIATSTVKNKQATSITATSTKRK